MLDLAVVVLSYNQGKYLKQALESIFSQKCTFDYEVVVADDASTDNSAEIAKEFGKSHSNLRLVQNKKNIGPVANFRKTLSQIHAKYVLLNDGDDYLTDEHVLQEQHDYLERHKDCSVCFHQCLFKHEGKEAAGCDDSFFPSAEMLEKHNYSFCLYDLLKRNFMQTNSIMYRWRFNDEDFSKVFPEDCQPCDWLLSILHAQKGKIHAIENTGSVYRIHADSLWYGGGNSRKWVDRNAVPHINFLQYLDNEIAPINTKWVNFIISMSALYIRNCLLDGNVDGLSSFAGNYGRRFKAVCYCLTKDYSFKVAFPYSISMNRVLKNFRKRYFKHLIKDKEKDFYAVSLLIERLAKLGNDAYERSVKSGA